MTIETTLERIATAAERTERIMAEMLAVLNKAPAAPEQKVIDFPAHAPAPTPEPAPAPATHVQPPPPIPAAFIPPAPQQQPNLPFSDKEGFLKYCMERYRALGVERGGMIPTILNGMGFANVSDVPANRYAEFYAKCEAL